MKTLRTVSFPVNMCIYINTEYWPEYSFKGYLHCKTITSQNVPPEAQINNFFFIEKFLRYSSLCIFNHPMIYEICDVMMSINA